MSGIQIDECIARTQELIRLFESKAPDDDLRRSTMDVLEFLSDQSNLLYDLVQGRSKELGRSGEDYLSGVKLGELSYQIAVILREYGVKKAEEMALRIRLKALLQVQGHHYDVIGPAMLEHAALLYALGWVDEAASNYDCIIDDFSWLIDEHHDYQDYITEEDLISLNALQTALSKRLDIGQLSAANIAGISNKIEKVGQILARDDLS